MKKSQLADIKLPPILFDPHIEMLNDDKLCAPSDRDLSKSTLNNSESKIISFSKSMVEDT